MRSAQLSAYSPQCCGEGAALSEREARGSGSVEEMLPTLLVCGRASVVVGGEGRLLFVLRVSMVTTSSVARI